ncbi:peptidoglycan-binding protein [Stenotrophomonas sp. SORGH_AS_0282]|jgi:putative chitinase|uniref:peptidoglycan-binding protein n=1 Tax=Stenotrophomonas TaxID=40323 RepID=UPI002780ADCF|nr:peptidoglycan-binding protein [Stenotrophomonas sp. SORGH_AS_0282]MDQ1061040.1 putative chitinase [Stenotrophomonas sp. SORGH_AS_0282]MDQ1190613.1 putative chitinase [Stenotrophomonas sp. SORGH_AS_0282]
MPNDIYTNMVQPPGAAYRSNQIESWSHYREPIDESRALHGQSRRWGDASPEVQSRVIDSLIESSREAGLTPRETAYVLAIARVESGFNPDAAAGTTSASGLGQFIDRTGKHYGLNNANRFDVDAQSDALVAHFVDNRNLARDRGQGEDYIYKYHHDGPTKDYGGLGLSQRKVAPHLDEYEQFVNQRLSQTQAQAPAQQHAVAGAAAAVAGAAAVGAAATQVRSYEHTMQVMLPPQNGVKPHITGHFGEHRGEKSHGGSDFNYVGGQTGRNLQHPTIHAPIAGTVTSVGGKYGTVMIQDAQGNSHQILHMQDTKVKVGQHVEPGDPIGTMGGRGPQGANQYAQHVHYQMKDPAGKLINPETYWNKGIQQEAGKHGHAHDHDHAPAGTLRKGDRSDEVTKLQEELNRLGVRDANGNRLSEDGKFGDNTREAVQAFQKQQGLKDDGIVGRETFGKLAATQAQGAETRTATGPQLGEKGHADTPLHNAIRGQLPAAISNEAAANVTLQAKQAGIDSPEKLQSVTVQDGKAFVMGTTPGYRTAVDLSEAPSLEHTNAQLQSNNASQQQQVQEEQQKVAMGR